MEPVYVPNNPHEKAMQRVLIQYRNPKNLELVTEALTKAHRTDLIGFDKKCLIRPIRGEGKSSSYSSGRYGKPSGDKNGGKGEKNNGASFGNGKDKNKPVKKKTIRNVHKKK